MRISASSSELIDRNIMGMSPDQIRLLRAEFRGMDAVELLEYAHDLLTERQADITAELADLRWEEFGRLADRIARTSAAPGWRDMPEIDDLRDFCLSEELKHLQSHDGGGVLRRVTTRLIRKVWGMFPQN